MEILVKAATLPVRTIAVRPLAQDASHLTQGGRVGQKVKLAP